MSLYASKKAIEITIKLFTDLHECSNCGSFFTELENVGCWECKYHPGVYDNKLDCYTCCGQKMRRPAFNHRGYGHFMTWGSKDKWNRALEMPEGCCRRDCQSKKETPIPDDVLPVDDIATLIPYMVKKVDTRPGLKRGPLRLERQEKRPYAIWKKVPSNI
jgi:hypothetical protein